MSVLIKSRHRNTVYSKDNLPCIPFIFAERFWAKVQIHSSDECWPWTGALSAKQSKWSYGYFSINKKMTKASRVCLEAKLGRPILAGLCALHTCDNTICVNPNHLYEGTLKQNTRDMKIRNRQPTRRSSRRFTDEQIRRIRRISDMGVSHRDIAKRYFISKSVAQGIVNRTKYKDVL